MQAVVRALKYRLPDPEYGSSVLVRKSPEANNLFREMKRES